MLRQMFRARIHGVIIISYALCDEDEARRLRPIVVKVDDRNRILRD